MKLGITTRLFLGVLATSVLVAVAMGVAARFSFTRGFVGYLNEQGVERVESVVPDLAEAWTEHGNWDFLRDNPRAWFRLIRPPRPDRDLPRGERPRRTPPLSDLIGVNLRVALLDAGRELVIGNPETGPDAVERPIVVDGRAVGFLAVVPFEDVTAPADLRFQQQQFVATWVVGALAVLLAAAVAMWLARTLVAPLKRIAAATQRLAGGDYATRIEAASGDEIGRLAGDFNRLALALERNEQMRRSFMADVSHELRTPLAVLRGEVEALEDGVRLATPESLRSLKAEVCTLNKLVDDLYDLSLSDLGALAYRMRPLDLREVLDGALATAAERLAGHRILLERRLPEVPLFAHADAARLRQLFQNLVENVLRYANEGGQMRVICEREGTAAVVVFEDSGPGVADQQLPRLFERFYRVEGSRNRASGGAGLGLAICRNIVEAHGGAIEARRSALGGLGVVIRLPLATH